MRFWDASAIVPLLVSEESSGRMRALLAEDTAVVTWWGTRVECASAIARLEREGVLDNPLASRSLEALGGLSAIWNEIVPSGLVRETALRLMRVHPLRAADALQLSAACVMTGAQTNGGRFVCLDQRLRVAAEKEGFALLPV